MPFKKGQPRPPGAGRKKGQKNKYNLPSVQEVLHSKKLDPLEELIRLAQDEKMPLEEKRKIWADILTYTRPKAKTEIDLSSPAHSPEVPEQLAPTAQLLSLVKGGSVAAPKAEEQKTEQPTPETGKSGS